MMRMEVNAAMDKIDRENGLVLRLEVLAVLRIPGWILQDDYGRGRQKGVIVQLLELS